MKCTIPPAVCLMLDKFHRSLPPHKRKRLQFACVINATSMRHVATELEELAAEIRRASMGVGDVGHGGGYYMSLTYASTKTNNQ